MSDDSALVEWMAEALAPVGSVRSTRMFSGTGVYCDGLFFALIFGGDLYLKADAVNAPRYDALGLLPFVYTAKGKSVSINYRRAPEECFDDAETMCDWAEVALGAARRATDKSPSSRRRPGPVRR
jgi:DNA transformation protein and related proteins